MTLYFGRDKDDASVSWVVLRATAEYLRISSADVQEGP